MKTWRRHASTGGLVLAWTAFLVVMLVTIRAQWSGQGAMTVLATFVAVFWLVGVIALRFRQGEAWLDNARAAGFEPATDSWLGRAIGRPPITGVVEDRTVRVEPYEAGVRPRNRTAFRTPVRGVSDPLDVTLNAHVDDPMALEPFTVESGDAADLLTVPVQSALMDAVKPGEISITSSEVVYRVPRSRFGSEELSRCARVVALLADRTEAVRATPVQ
ncbi:hypothetical protein VB773_00725 [Haloarculaceae archaeon H-GB2-1]|nr:hypothetical protein [Haloarculaceae archaeon H-GB1-1]MEA5388225.1 hypothetical protein [Haloarculaceae archaeon H-GB11]MEA5406247.1 hypothetical protein [Haloarculaceae archaeon H-GB2-1]